MDKSKSTTVLTQNVEASQQEAVCEKSGTLKDAEDMQRLGRIQELRVRCVGMVSSTKITNLFTAKLQFPEHLGLCHDFNEHMAGPSCVSYTTRSAEDDLKYLTSIQRRRIRDS